MNVTFQKIRSRVKRRNKQKKILIFTEYQFEYKVGSVKKVKFCSIAKVDQIRKWIGSVVQFGVAEGSIGAAFGKIKTFRNMHASVCSDRPDKLIITTSNSKYDHS